MRGSDFIAGNVIEFNQVKVTASCRKNLRNTTVKKKNNVKQQKHNNNVKKSYSYIHFLQFSKKNKFKQWGWFFFFCGFVLF